MNDYKDGLCSKDFDGFSLPAIAREIVFLEEVSSTNDFAKGLAQNGKPSGTVVVAGKQLKGRGRLGRSWDGGAGLDIYLSLLIKPDEGSTLAQCITLLAGLCAANIINGYLPKKNALIKWPNDVVADGKKLCGILAESGVCEKGENFIILGIGINVNRDSFPPELLECASSLHMLTGSNFKRAEIIKKLLFEIDYYYTEFIRGGAASFMNGYRSLCVNLGKEVLISSSTEEYKGIAVNVSDNGLLEVLKENGETVSVLSGEVSVRGIYGYV